MQWVQRILDNPDLIILLTRFSTGTRRGNNRFHSCPLSEREIWLNPNVIFILGYLSKVSVMSVIERSSNVY